MRTASNSSISAGVGTMLAIGRASPRPAAPNFSSASLPTRIAQVNAGDGEVERDLLVGLERQVGQVNASRSIRYPYWSLPASVP